MEVLLDTSFVISCIRKRIDFITELSNLGFKIALPREVFQELRDLKKNPKESRADRQAVDIAFEMFSKRKIKKTTVGGRNVDEGLINKGKQGTYIATLDNGIKREIPNKVVIVNSKRSISVER